MLDTGVGGVPVGARCTTCMWETDHNGTGLGAESWGHIFALLIHFLSLTKKKVQITRYLLSIRISYVGFCISILFILNGNKDTMFQDAKARLFKVQCSAIITWSVFSQIFTEDTHSSPVMWRYGVSLWIQHLIDILPQFQQLVMQYLAILDSGIMALNCITGALAEQIRSLCGFIWLQHRVYLVYVWPPFQGYIWVTLPYLLRFYVISYH